MDILQQFRAAIDADPRTRQAIARETGIDPAALHRFYHDERGLNCWTLARLADVLGLELQPVDPAGKPKASKRTTKRKP